VQLCEYVRMMVWPWPLRVSYEDFTGQAFRAAVAVHAAALAVALAARRRAPLVTFALAFFYTALLPVTQLAASAGGKVQLGAFSLDRPALPLLINERVAYVPSVALALLAAVGLTALARRWGTPLALVCCAAPLAAGAFMTWNRNVAWHESVRLYEAEVKAAPDNGDGWRHLIAEYSAIGRISEGAAACDVQMRRDFRSAYFFINCGSIYFQLNRYDDAMRAYRRAIELGLPAVGHMNLGRVLARLGRSTEAEAEFVAAAETESNPVVRHFRRGQWLTRFHPERRAEAIDEYGRALALQPNYAPAQKALKSLRP
jgi:tetratricopeptide (TPR) repeat protein